MKQQSIFIKITMKILVCAVLSLILTMIFCRDAFSRFVVIRILIAVIMAIGLNVTTGLTGQLSMGQAAFMGISAYSSAMCAINLGGSFGIIAGLILSLILCGLSAFIIGFCVLRLSGDYLALATLGFGEIVRIIFENSEKFGSAAGLYNIPKYSSVAAATLACTACSVLFVRYKYSNVGLLSSAVKDNEDAAAACGINNSIRLKPGVCSGCNDMFRLPDGFTVDLSDLFLLGLFIFPARSILWRRLFWAVPVMYSARCLPLV